MRYIETIQGTVTALDSVSTVATTSAVSNSGTYLIKIDGTVVGRSVNGGTVALGYCVNSGTDVLNTTASNSSRKTYVDSFSAEEILTAGDTVSLRGRYGQATPRVSLTLWRIT